jgi:hypothetical protein
MSVTTVTRALGDTTLVLANATSHAGIVPASCFWWRSSRARDGRFTSKWRCQCGCRMLADLSRVNFGQVVFQRKVLRMLLRTGVCPPGTMFPNSDGMSKATKVRRRISTWEIVRRTLHALVCCYKQRALAALSIRVATACGYIDRVAALGLDDHRRENRVSSDWTHSGGRIEATT